MSTPKKPLKAEMQPASIQCTEPKATVQLPFRVGTEPYTFSQQVDYAGGAMDVTTLRATAYKQLAANLEAILSEIYHQYGTPAPPAKEKK